MQDETTPADVVRALRARGVDDPEMLLECGSPDEILAACRRWDRRKGVGKGLLVKWIREGQFDEPEPQPKQSRDAILRARFDDYARRLPAGSSVEPHAQLQARRREDQDSCDGRMVVYESIYPNVTVECDRCGFVAAYPIRMLAAVWANYHQPPEEVF
jgi:hypothetical protein